MSHCPSVYSWQKDGQALGLKIKSLHVSIIKKFVCMGSNVGDNKYASAHQKIDSPLQ